MDGSSASNSAYYNRRRSSLEIYRTFLDEFLASNGGWLLILLGFLTALGAGALVGAVPQVLTQKFAEHQYGLDKEIQCLSEEPLPMECVQGADYAQGAASYTSLFRNLMALLVNSVAGSYSDTHGRRGVQIASLFLVVLSPISFWLIQISDEVPPIWYYILDCFAGIISWFSIGFTQLSDIMPQRHRAAAFGLYFGSFMAGIAIAPFLATLMTHVQIAVFSSLVRIVALLIAILFLPETLPVENRRRSSHLAVHDDYVAAHPNSKKSWWKLLLSPIVKMSILQRSSSLLLVAFGAFTSKMVFSADVTLFFYYIEANLGATEQDVAGMMFTTGVVGVLVQAGFLKYLISFFGERRLLILSFCSGMAHNLIYGLAPNKWFLYVGLCLSALTNTNNALLSSLASRSVARTEQGHIQGALFSLTSLAEAIGPISFNFIYRNWHTFGSGTMFVVGAMLFGVGMVAVSLVPPKEVNDDDDDEQEGDDKFADEEESTSDLDGSQEEKEILVLP
ncbi:solute carrier family 46 [Seminavis robusta]|uniref:Solute carrier family 46 n=1 Tax=Seminavis robusta TaxID=568900 RepID=A0A9N8DAD0_9STRA|nr:solute carrier family 46 [Seminavis robusta]|eukprot:Sro32_g020890.1 solute carrier family 46 (506) ;mRNA; r:102869-104489